MTTCSTENMGPGCGPSHVSLNLPAFTAHWSVLISRDFIRVSHHRSQVSSPFRLITMSYSGLIEYTLSPCYVLSPMLVGVGMGCECVGEAQASHHESKRGRIQREVIGLSSQIRRLLRVKAALKITKLIGLQHMETRTIMGNWESGSHFLYTIEFGLYRPSTLSGLICKACRVTARGPEPPPPGSQLLLVLLFSFESLPFRNL